jgi:hypothetical protein
METKLLVKDSDNELIHKFSKALLDQGIVDGADCYFISDNNQLPFFKIPKNYKKENENDPDVHYVFVDIDDKPPFLGCEEYTVFGNFHHDHIPNAESAAELVKKLISGELCEVALVFEYAKAATFMKNTGDPQKNVDNFMEHYADLEKHIKSAVVGGHHHVIFMPSFPHNLYYCVGKQEMFQGIQAYVVSSILAEHPEFYILA